MMEQRERKESQARSDWISKATRSRCACGIVCHEMMKTEVVKELDYQTSRGLSEGRV